MSAVKSILKSKGAGRNQAVGIPNRRLNEAVQASLYKTSLGIEIELEGENLPAAGYLDGILAPSSGVTWQVKNDGSLRGGLEYVLTGPCNEDEVAYLCNGLFDVFRRRKTTLTPSNRCSVHVHYNVGGLKVNAITSIIALWAVFEEPLLRTWGDARYKNHFCLSTKDEESTLAAWEHFLRTGRLPEDRNLRYSALNLVAIRTYGSVEFRGGGAVNSAEEVVTWTRLLHRLCKYAEERYPNPQQIAYDLSERGPWAILQDICGTEFEDFANRAYRTVNNFAQTCMDSFHNVQPILFDFPWGEWVEEINKPYVPNPFSTKTKNKKGYEIRIDPVQPAAPRMVRMVDIENGNQAVNWAEIVGRGARPHNEEF